MSACLCTNKTYTDELMNEACVLHRAVFKSEIPMDVARRYVSAHEYYVVNATEKDLLWMRRTVQLGLDVEALDIALRKIDKNHILIRKVKMLIYICEAYHKYYDFFISERAEREKAFLILFFHGIRSLYKFLKGTFLLLQYRNSGMNDV